MAGWISLSYKDGNHCSLTASSRLVPTGNIASHDNKLNITCINGNGTLLIISVFFFITLFVLFCKYLFLGFLTTLMSGDLEYYRISYFLLSEVFNYLVIFRKSVAVVSCCTAKSSAFCHLQEQTSKLSDFPEWPVPTTVPRTSPATWLRAGLCEVVLGRDTESRVHTRSQGGTPLWYFIRLRQWPMLLPTLPATSLADFL